MDSMKQYPISIVIPVYNEADNVQVLTSEIIRTVNFTQYEIIFIDDGSQDKTVEHLQKLTLQYRQVKFISHIVNFGQSASIITGIKAAKHDWIVTMDGDLQNDPVDIFALLTTAMKHAMENKHQIAVIGIRETRDDQWIRKISSKIANFIRRKLLKDDCQDTGCGLKLFSREMFFRLPIFNNMHRYFPALFKSIGINVLQVPVNHRPRIKGKSKYGIHNRLWVGIPDLLGVMWLLRRTYQAKVKNELL